MQIQSFLTQTPLFQGFLLPKRKHKEEFWVSSRTEVPVFGVETPSQMFPISFGEGDKGGEDQRFSLCKSWDIVRYDCLLELIQKLSGEQAFGTYLNDFYTGNKNANFPTFFAHTRNRLELSELYIYGSGRLGNLEQNLILHAGTKQQAVWNPFIEDPSHQTDSLLDEHESIASTPEIYTTSATHKSFVIGQKRYEISNHLGNVTSVITDRKFGVPVSGTDPTISYYLADIVSATDYDPYGQALPGRVWNRSGYRFGFNGQELDSELGEIWSAEFWEYDASLGRRWDIDPIDLPWQSPYVGLDNNPIAFSDHLGLAATSDGDGPKDAKGKVRKSESKNDFDGDDEGRNWKGNGKGGWDKAKDINLPEVSIVDKDPRKKEAYDMNRRSLNKSNGVEQKEPDHGLANDFYNTPTREQLEADLEWKRKNPQSGRLESMDGEVFVTVITGYAEAKAAATLLRSTFRFSFSDAVKAGVKSFADEGKGTTNSFNYALPVKYDPQFAVSQALEAEKLDFAKLKIMIPKGTPNTFSPENGGEKFSFEINGIKIQLKWHLPQFGGNPPIGSNSALFKTAQIKVGNKYLTSTGNFIRSNRTNETHIPLKE